MGLGQKTAIQLMVERDQVELLGLPRVLVARPPAPPPPGELYATAGFPEPVNTIATNRAPHPADNAIAERAPEGRRGGSSPTS